MCKEMQLLIDRELADSEIARHTIRDGVFWLTL